MLAASTIISSVVSIPRRIALGILVHRSVLVLGESSDKGWGLFVVVFAISRCLYSQVHIHIKSLFIYANPCFSEVSAVG